MAQLRHDYEQFCSLNAEVLVMVPNGPFMIRDYVKLTSNPYPILSDKGSRVAGQYFQVKHFVKLGTPTVFLVDRQGTIRYAHYASSLLEEPDSEEPKAILADMGSE